MEQLGWFRRLPSVDQTAEPVQVEQPETSVVVTLDTPTCISGCITKIVADMHQAITNHQAESGCIAKIVADMHQAITNHQADLNMVMMVPQICYSY